MLSSLEFYHLELLGGLCHQERESLPESKAKVEKSSAKRWRKINSFNIT